MSDAPPPQRRPLPQTAADTSAEQPWPVRVLTTKMDAHLAKMPTVWVEGQLVEVRIRGGTAYLVLRDADVDMSLPVTCRAVLLESLRPAAADGRYDGMRVVLRASPEFWPKRGVLQLKAVALRPVGVGELLARLDHLKRVLASEGLLDAARKRPLPFLPRVVGLVCGRGSAAERDVLATARARWPAVRFAVHEVPVQGAAAVTAVTEAVLALDAREDVDVVVVARGGGSLEDLLAFSNETLLRAVAGCRTPVVSAIGHEVDSPLLDLVADVRASTPTDAGRRVVPAVAEQLAGLQGARDRLRRALAGLLAAQAQQLQSVRSRPVLRDPHALLDDQQHLVAGASGRGRRALATRLDRAQDQVQHLRAGVRTLSPAATLERGYAVVQLAGGRVLRSDDQAAAGDRLRVRLADGELRAEVLPQTRGPVGRPDPRPAG